MRSPQVNGHRPKIVVIGGGSGSSNLLRGLKRYTSELTAIVTMFDSGGSSGLLREEFGFPPFGDLRQCLLALGDATQETQAVREALAFRFSSKSSLNGHNVGNLFMAALTSLNNDLEKAVDTMGQLLRVNGQVIPVTLQRADLCAELEDGSIVSGESNIDLRTASIPRIKRIFLDAEVQANPRAISAVTEANAVVLGPGDLYTSILPNLLARGLREAIAECQATRIYVCNLMTKRGETDNFKASDFLREVTRYLGRANLDWAVVNITTPSAAIQQAYVEEEAYPVEADLEDVKGYVNGVLAAPLATNELPLRHDSQRTAEVILQLMAAGRVTQGSSRSSLPASV
jgi:uncharacterized cofD-like protein